MFVLDSHCDTPSSIFRLTDVSKRNTIGHVDFPRMREGGVDGAFFALYVPADLAPDASTTYAMKLAGCLDDALRASSEMAAYAYSPEDAICNKSKGLISVFIGLENGSPIQKSLSLLRKFYSLGVRYMTLCHSSDNEICDSCADGHRWGGLSPFGKEVIAEMNRLGMLIDVSHIADWSFWDVLEYTASPIVASHSCCRALSDHPRNMSDEMLRALAQNGGVIQINFYPVFLDAAFSEVLSASGLDKPSSLTRPSYRRIADHIDHAVEVAGIDHVGLGSDFDGIEVTPEGMDDISDFSLIFTELRSRGYDEISIAKIAGGNFLRVFSENIKR